MVVYDAMLSKLRDTVETDQLNQRLSVVESTVNIVVSGGTPFNGSLSFGRHDDGSEIIMGRHTAD